MSRAFVTDKEDWAYCAKAMERCLHASPGRDCGKRDCEHYDREAPVRREEVAMRTVKRAAAKKDVSRPEPRKTKKSSLKIKRKWGGRSGDL